MPDSYPFNTYSGLLEPKHYKRIGTAIWLFLWCISSTTKEITRDGITWGIVLGNKPLKLTELSEIFGVDEKTIRRWLKALEEHEYIKITRAPYGIILSVKNSKKFKERVDKNVQSDRERTKMSSPDRTEMPTLSDKNVQSNKDITGDITNNTTTINDDIDLIADRFRELRSIQTGKEILHPKQKDYEAIAQIVALGVPTSITIELLELCFKEYNEREPGGEITSFRYCLKFISDKWKDMQAREEAKKQGVSLANKNPSRRRDFVRKDKLPSWIENQGEKEKEPAAEENSISDQQKRERMKQLLKAHGEWDEEKGAS